MKIITGVCVGGGLFLIILLCVFVVVLCRRRTQRTASWNLKQQDLKLQPLPHQPQQKHRLQEKEKGVDDQGYINDHMAPKQGMTFDNPPDNGEYLHPTPMRGNPINQMALSGDYLNHHHMTPKSGNHINRILSSSEYLHTDGIPTDHMTLSEDNVDDYLAPKGGIDIVNHPGETV